MANISIPLKQYGAYESESVRPFAEKQHDAWELCEDGLLMISILQQVVVLSDRDQLQMRLAAYELLYIGASDILEKIADTSVGLWEFVSAACEKYAAQCVNDAQHLRDDSLRIEITRRQADKLYRKKLSRFIRESIPHLPILNN